MSEESTPSPQENSTVDAATQTPIPTDYREYVKWRETGELPQRNEETQQPAAAGSDSDESVSQAKREPQSGAEEVQQTEEETEEPEVQDQPIGKRGVQRQRKIDRLERENELLKQQLAALPPRERPAPREPATAPEPPGKPRLHDYETLEAYQEALTDWKIDQRDMKAKAEADKAEAKAAAEKLQAAWNSSENLARAAHADYDEVLESVKAPDGPGANAARQAMLEDEAGAEILYYLGTHPDELKRIAALQPMAAIMAVGKIAAAVAKPSEPGNGKRTVSGAPKPPPALSRPAKTATDNVLDENLARDFKRWSRAREAQLKG